VSDVRRALPSVSSLLSDDAIAALEQRAPRTLVVRATRGAIEAVRCGDDPAPSDAAGWLARIVDELALIERASLRPVFNATGVVLHTNLGRAPLAEEAIAAMGRVASGFSNLEYDLAAGARGSRHSHCVALLRELTGAEDALVMNNCAAALVLALRAHARDREVIVSRGELVEIGGSFRIPDILGTSGARLVEVGTTNRTYARDYLAALSDNTGALLKVHRSNFAIEGFTTEASLAELASVAQRRGVPLMHDFGSGLMVDLSPFGLRGELTAPDAISAGADLVVMSGDKLLGGPQSGIILGTAAAVEPLRRDPMARALRVDKLTLSALEATLALYRDTESALRRVPALRMLTEPVESVRARATEVAELLMAAGVPCSVEDSTATVGGGAFPTSQIPSAALVLAGSPDALDARLRAAETPVVARVADGRLWCDLRSVPEAHTRAFGRALTRAVTRALQ